MKLVRQFTQPSDKPLSHLEFEQRSSKIANPDGSVVFEAKDIRIPKGWSQVAVDILAQKYFRKAGIPTRLRRVPEPGVPDWLWRSEPDDEELAEMPVEERTRGEGDSVRGLPPPRRILDLLGLAPRLLQRRGVGPRLLRRDDAHAGHADGRAQ